MNDWPVWIRVRLKNDPAITALLPAGEDGIHGAGSLQGPPQKKPFIVIHTDDELRGPFPGRGLSRCSVHVHDKEGSYNRIRLILHRVRDSLCGPGSDQGQANGTGVTGGGTCRWINDSGDLADEGFKTLCRTSQYELTGADGND